MSDKKRANSAQSRREDEVLNRTLIWICGAAVLIMILLLTNRYYVNYRTNEIEQAYRLSKILPILAGVGVAAGLAGAVMAWSAHKKDTSCKWWVTLAAFCGTLGVMLAMVWRFQAFGVQIMCALIPAAAILAMVYYLFQREFFVIALTSGVGMLGLWMVRRLAGRTPLYVVLALIAVFLAAVALLTRKVQGAGGMWKDRRILSKNAAYPMIYITCAVVAVLLAAAMVAGNLAFYLMFPAVAWLVVMAVYFTVKLM